MQRLARVVVPHALVAASLDSLQEGVRGASQGKPAGLGSRPLT